MSTFEKPPSSRPAITDDPLPQAADSLHDQLDEQIYDKGMFWLMSAVVLAGWCAYEWFQYAFPMKRTLTSSILLTIFTAAYVGLAILRFFGAVRRARSIKLGIRGERHVGQYLHKECGTLGYRVFDDIPCTGSGGKFNIDHALIGPAGIFTIETKNWTLPAKGTHAKINFDPETNTLIKPDGTFDNKAVLQAKANADFLRKLLAQRTARKSPPFTRPVLILPGWYVNDTTPKPRPIWIIGNDTLHQMAPRRTHRSPNPRRHRPPLRRPRRLHPQSAQITLSTPGLNPCGTTSSRLRPPIPTNLVDIPTKNSRTTPFPVRNPRSPNNLH